jgi:hypothetical protein
VKVDLSAIVPGTVEHSASIDENPRPLTTPFLRGKTASMVSTQQLHASALSMPAAALPCGIVTVLAICESTPI